MEARASLLAVGLLGLISVSARGQNVTPMVYDIAPSGRESARTVEYWNTQNRATAIEIAVARRSFDENGQAVDTHASGDFEFLPQQFLVAAGERQKIRVRYVGPKLLPTSATYAISFRQVPIQGAGADPKLRFLFDFKTLANVVPKDAKPDIVVQSAQAEGETARVTFANRGTSYGRLDTAALRLSTGNRIQVIDPATLREGYDLRWIMPGATRTVSIPLQFQVVGPLSAERLEAQQ